MSHKSQAAHKFQSGNVLFLILIAVALFAALSYVVTQSARSGAGNQRDNAALEAANLMNFFVSIVTEYQKDMVMRPNALRIAAGGGFALCSTATVSCFWKNHPALPTDVRVRKKNYALNATGTNQNRGVTGIGPTAGDDIIWINDLPEDVCAAINKGLGLAALQPNTGNYPANQFDLPEPQHSACATNQNGVRIYYSVLREG